MVSDWVIENVETSFQKELNQLDSKEEKRSLILKYLRNRLYKANPYQVHIDCVEDRKIVRFGDYGLNGGGRKTAIAISSAEVLAGVAVCSTGLGILWGSSLISSGLKSGFYAYGQKRHEFRSGEYMQCQVSGALSGVASTFIGLQGEAAGTVAQIGWQILGGGTASAVSQTTTEAIEYLNKKKKN